MLCKFVLELSPNQLFFDEILAEFCVGSQKRNFVDEVGRKTSFSSGQCSFSCLFGATGQLAVPGGWTSPPLCELRTVLQKDIFSHRVFRVFGLCTLGPHSFSPHPVRQNFQQFLQRCSYLCFLCYAKNSLLCFRPFPETTFLERRRCRGAVLKKREKR